MIKSFEICKKTFYTGHVTLDHSSINILVQMLIYYLYFDSSIPGQEPKYLPFEVIKLFLMVLQIGSHEDFVYNFLIVV